MINKMNINDKVNLAVELLKKEYPVCKCTLDYQNDLQLLIATRLAAQCTDARVNIVTPKLFEKYKNAKEFSEAKIEDIQDIIKSCGFYKVKSLDIIEICKKIMKDFNGKVPDNIENLTSLPGIGRKTANVLLAEIYKKDVVIVDTHFTRLTTRLGFHNMKDPVKIEFFMKDLLPKNESTNFCHRLVAHGRLVCTAINPKCDSCCLKKICRFGNSKSTN